MKKLFALSSAFLSLAVLIPVVGCGGTGSSDYYPVGASITDNGTRGIRVSWPQINTAQPDSVVEYQIVRTSPSDAVPTELVVGVVGPNATTFVDTVQSHVVTYNNLTGGDSFQGIGPSPVPMTVTSPGLTPGSYVYSVRALVHFTKPSQYSLTSALEPTAPVLFQ